MFKGKPTVACGVGLTLVLAACAWPSSSAAQTVSSAIRLDTVGYLPARGKRASVPAPCKEFTVRREPGGAVVFSGKASPPLRNEDTGEEIYVADFSALKKPGRYFLDVPGVGRSAPFRAVGDDRRAHPPR